MNLQLEMIFATTRGGRHTFRMDGYTTETLPSDQTIRELMQSLADTNIIDHRHHDFARPITYRIVSIQHAPR